MTAWEEVFLLLARRKFAVGEVPFSNKIREITARSAELMYHELI
jgi:hypothetical protein